MDATTYELSSKYVRDDGLHCPICGSANLYRQDIFMPFDEMVEAVRYIDCNACGESWTEIFTLDRITMGL